MTRRSLTARLAALGLCAAALLTTSGARAEEPPALAWSPTWPKFRPVEIAFTAGLSLQIAEATLRYPAPARNWTGGILFDDAVRRALRLHDRRARETAGKVSDYLYYTLAAYPLVDAGIVAGAVHGSGEVALQMTAIDLESYALSGAIALSAEKIGRVRPYDRGCRHDPHYSKNCGRAADENASFMSGHTTASFTAAGLVCVHHLHLPLYGGGAPDALACVAAFTAASAAGALRIASDNHYSSDVLLGVGVGLASGFVVPTLLHYGASASGSPSALPTYISERTGFSAVLAPEVGPSLVGLTLAGTF